MYAHILKNNNDQPRSNHNKDARPSHQQATNLPFGHLEFNIEDKEEWCKFKKAYVGVMENLCMTYNIQDIFNIGGYFEIKVTLLGEILCLLEKGRRRNHSACGKGK